MKLMNFVIVVAFLFVLSCGQQADNTDETNTSDQEVVDNTATDDSDATSDSSEVEDANLVDTTATADNTEIVVVGDESEKMNDEGKEKKYYLIVGSFKEFENAKRLSKELAEKGNKSEIMLPVEDFNRVAKTSFKTRAEAETAARDWRKNHNNDISTAWIWYK